MALVLFLVGCGGSSGPTLIPTPVVTSLSPDSAVAGGASFTLTLSGTGFQATSQVFWNGSCITATPPSTTCATAAFNVNTQQLSVSVPAAYIASPGFPQITVVNPFPGGPSLVAATFTISAASNPVPTITSLSPTNTPVGQLPTNSLLTVNGTNFIATSTVSFNGNPRATHFVSATQLTATVLASDVASGGGIIVKVSNPSPGGGVSAGSTFTVGPVPGAIGQRAFLSGAQISPELVSINAAGGPSNGASAAPTVSADGRFVAFYSTATNLVTTGPSGNIFVRDTCLAAINCTPQTLAVDLDVNGNAPGAPSLEQVAISADGRFVAFSSAALNLVGSSDAPRRGIGAQVYLRDLCEGDSASAGCSPRTQLVSVDPTGAPVSGSFPAISSDGRFVAFVSIPEVPTAASSTKVPQIYVRDTCAGATANSRCEPATVPVDLIGADPIATEPVAISANGRYVAVTVSALPTISSAIQRQSEILLADTCLGADAPAGCVAKAISASVAADGSPLPGRNSHPTISADGRFVVFESNNGAPDDSSASQIYLRDTCLGSSAPNGCAATTSLIASDATNPSISSAGRYITYITGGEVVDASGTASVPLYVYDTCFGADTPCTPAASPVPGAMVQASSSLPVNSDGRVAAFASKSSIAALPSSGLGDVYLIPISH